MNRVAIRKLVLLAAAFMLLVIYALQLALTGRSTVTELDALPEPDAVEIAAADAVPVRLEKGADGWTVGDRRYAAEQYSVQAVLDAVQSVTLLGTAARSAAPADERYGLGDGSRITVTAYKDGAALRTLYVGKNTSTGSQSYVQVDGKGAVYLAQGALRSTFGVTEDSLRSKRVYSLAASDITSVAVASVAENERYGIARDAPAEDGGASEWRLFPSYSSAVQALDSQKVSSWVSQLASLSASAWAADGTTVEGAAEAGSATITTADGEVHAIALYALADDEERYLCTSGDTPYLFYLNKYAAQKFQKPLGELLAQDAE